MWNKILTKITTTSTFCAKCQTNLSSTTSTTNLQGSCQHISNEMTEHPQNLPLSFAQKKEHKYVLKFILISNPSMHKLGNEYAPFKKKIMCLM
jgi:hypothetical protein